MYTRISTKEGIDIKRNFEDVIKENTAWLLRYIQDKIYSKSLAEDMLQEIWLKAFKAYEDYVENGALKAWLLRIASNHLNNYYSRRTVQCISLDYNDEEFDSLYGYLSSSEPTPEEKAVYDELVSNVLDKLATLPTKQQQMITYRYFYDMSIEEISNKMNIPKGTVKSTTHYAIEALKKHFNTNKGERIMECKEIYKYLFIYANGTIQKEYKKLVDEHIKACDKCKDIVIALQKLIPTMVFAQEDEMTYFCISMPEIGLAYTGYRIEFPKYKEIQKALDKVNGNIPDTDMIMTSGFTKGCEMSARFDNEGNEIIMKVYEENETHRRVKASYMKKVFKYFWCYDVYENHSIMAHFIKQSKEAPNLYYGSYNNQLGSQSKSALYQAIPKDAKNIRIKRGNGVIDCGTYKFPYVDRYVTEEEVIKLEYSFLLNR